MPSIISNRKNMQQHLIPLPKEHRNQSIQQQIQCKSNSNHCFPFGIDWDQ